MPRLVWYVVLNVVLVAVSVVLLVTYVVSNDVVVAILVPRLVW